MSNFKKISLCPVCGFDFYKYFGFKPWNNDLPSDEICPCCGIQFGFDDYERENRENLYSTWRNNWIQNGMRWWSKNQAMPNKWNPEVQIKNLPLDN